MNTQTLRVTPAILGNGNARTVSFDVVESRHYQAALTLNNIGVALLEKESYRDALATLKHALALIKGVAFMKRDQMASPHTDEITETTDHDSAYSYVNNAITLDDVNEYLNAASKKLRSKKPRSRNSRQNGNVESSHAGSEFLSASAKVAFDLTVVSDHDNDVLYDAAHSYPMHDSGYAIRIDTTCDYFTSHLSLETAIILMNYSVAYRCMASSKAAALNRESNLKEKFLKNALTLSEVSFQLLTSEATKYGQSILTANDDDDNRSTRSNDSESSVLSDCLLLERIELILLIVIQSLMHTSFELNMNDEGREYYAMLGDLHINAQNKRGPNEAEHSSDSASPSVCLKSVAPAA